MRRRAGVTLLELLLAVSLLGLLMAGILTALHTGVNAMGKANVRLMESRRLTGVQRILEQQIAGFMPVVATFRPDDGPVRSQPFFQGEPQSMRFVSAYSLAGAWRGYPQILEFQVIAGERGEGVRLVVNEHLFTGAPSAGVFCLGAVLDPALGVRVPVFRPIAAGPASFILADRLQRCRFLFREIPPPPAGPRWVERWILPRWPSAVRIEMEPLENGGVRPPPLSITAPIRVTAQPEVAYGG
jgi:general secretion pathway protein J